MPNILLIGEGTVSDDVRLRNIGQCLAAEGFSVLYQNLYYRDDDLPIPDSPVDVVFFGRPHHSDLLLYYKRKGIPIIVDADDDFRAIPETHPGYNYVGLGDTAFLRKYENCLYLADIVTTTTNILAERLREINPNVRVIPNGWSASNPNWYTKRHIYSDSVFIGWAGTITHREDFAVCLDAVRQALKKHKEARVLIAGDVEIYRKFKRISEKKKLYIPMMPYRLYPVLLSFCDIFLAPLEDNFFNRAKSDIKLVDAGAKGIPYIASNMTVYQSWGGGGILASTPDEWFEAIDKLVSDRVLRAKYAEEGHKLAQERLMSKLIDQWLEIINGVLS